MLTSERRQRILERVAERQTIQVGALAQELGVSEMTIRRDIGRLEREGFLRRSYGGATAHLTRSVELAFNARSLLNSAAKRQIGMAAARLVEGVVSMFIGIGTTAEQFALYLPPREGLLVITGSLPVASLLGGRPGQVVSLGGSVRREELSCEGPIAAASILRFHAELAVLGAAGLSERFGMTETDDETAEMQRLMIRQSDRVMVIADSSKLGVVAPAAVAPLSAIHTVVTDRGASSDSVAGLRAAGCEVVLAGPVDGHNGAPAGPR